MLVFSSWTKILLIKNNSLNASDYFLLFLTTKIYVNDKIL